MSRAIPCLAVAVLSCLWAGATLAADPVEAWRTPMGTPYAVAVNPTDHTGWAVTGNSITHLSADGVILSQTDGFVLPESIAVNPAGGSVWVADSGQDQVAHLAADGRVLWRGGTFLHPASVSVDPLDGSCWVADTHHDQIESVVAHLAANGTELWRSGVTRWPWQVVVNPADGTCWTVEAEVGPFGPTGWRLIHLASDGGELSRTGSYAWPGSLAVDPRDGSVWVADFGYASAPSVLVHVSKEGAELLRLADLSPANVAVNAADGSVWVVGMDQPAHLHSLFHLSADGGMLWQGGDPNMFSAGSLSVDPVDGSVWMFEWYSASVRRLGADGSELWRKGPLIPSPWVVAADEVDGSAWVMSLGEGTLRRVSSDGAVLWTTSGFDTVWSMVADPEDHTLWVADRGHRQLVHMAADGTEIWRGGSVRDPFCIARNPVDDTLWVIGFLDQDGSSGDHGQVLHVAPNGTVLWRSDAYPFPVSVSLDPRDGSVWLADDVLRVLVHLAADGGERFRLDLPAGSPLVAVNPVDGTCWVRTSENVLHLASDGTELWRSEFALFAFALTVNPADGTVWGADASGLVELGPDGSVLWRGGGVADVVSGISVNSDDGSIWVADGYNNQLVRFVQPGYQPPTFPDVPLNHWASAAVEAAVAAGLVEGYPDGVYQPSLPVTRDQMAVYISRALAGGDAGVPSGPAMAGFPDVPADHWAYRYIEYAAANGIVTGYPDGRYHPTNSVDRAQMAVFIARATAIPTGEAGVPDPGCHAPVFPDVPCDFWARKYVQFIKGKGVTSGYPDGLYHPSDPVTRDQMAVYVARAFQLPM